MSTASHAKKSEPNNAPETNLLPRADVRKIHEHGIRLLRILPKPVSGNRPRDVIENKAKELGINPAELRKRLLLAETYSKPELNELQALKTPQKKTLSWGHIRKLLTVKAPNERRRFEREAAKRGWSVHVLACEIEGRQGGGTPGGRPRKTLLQGVGMVGRPPNPRRLSPGTMRELQQEADQMVRLFNAFRDPKSGKLMSPMPEHRLTCKSQLKDFEATLQRLRGELELLTKQLRRATIRSTS